MSVWQEKRQRRQMINPPQNNFLIAVVCSKIIQGANQNNAIRWFHNLSLIQDEIDQLLADFEYPNAGNISLFFFFVVPAMQLLWRLQSDVSTFDVIRFAEYPNAFPMVRLVDEVLLANKCKLFDSIMSIFDKHRFLSLQWNDLTSLEECGCKFATNVGILKSCTWFFEKDNVPNRLNRILMRRLAEIFCHKWLTSLPVQIDLDGKSKN